MFRPLLALVLAGVLATACQAEITYEIRDDQAGSFIDIASTGNLISLGDDQERTVFSSFLGRNVRIGNNGGVALASNGNLGWVNRNLPSNQAFNRSEAFLPFWDDLDSESGSVHWQDMGDRLIVQWTERNHYRGTGVFEGVTLQAQIFRSSVGAVGGETLAQFVYQDTTFAPSQSQYNDGASATIGYQDGAGKFALYSFNTASVTAGTVLTVNAIPEPSSWMMFAVGVLALARRRRR